MTHLLRSFIIALVAMVGLSASAFATTYYVDYAGGDNRADGTSPRTAWKHSPGDTNATGNPAEIRLAAGDRIIFKGGVQYHGQIVLTVSGAAENPIVLDGNTAGNFGEGRAILDGGQVIGGWNRVQSAEQVGGNPRWSEIYYADIDVDVTTNVSQNRFVPHRKAPRDSQAPWQRVILADGEHGILPIAQSPKPSDPFYPDLPGDFYRSEETLGTEGNQSVIIDPENLTADDPSFYDGMMVGVHGGNNHVYFAPVIRFDPEGRRLLVPRFTARTYPQTRYALYNSVRLIRNPGEWAIRPLGDGRSRVYLLPARAQEDAPTDISFPTYGTAITIRNGASHHHIEGFLIQRYSGGEGGISVARARTRSQHITIRDCEIRFVSGHAGIGLNYCDHIVIERCFIHHSPGWTTAIFLNRVNHYAVSDSRLVKNSGSGIRHYECREGVVRNNVILDHFGMHASAINVYEGCANVLLEGNYIQNTATINRNADNIIFRNNVIDGMGRTAIAMAMWTSGTVGGRAIRDVQFINNTFVNVNPNVNWGAGLFGQGINSPSSPEGLVIRNNIIDRMGGDLPGTIQNNIFTRSVEPRLRGEDYQVITDLQKLFIDPANGDFRRRPGGPAMEVGADVPPPKDLQPSR